MILVPFCYCHSISVGREVARNLRVLDLGGFPWNWGIFYAFLGYFNTNRFIWGILDFGVFHGIRAYFVFLGYFNMSGFMLGGL